MEVLNCDARTSDMRAHMAVTAALGACAGFLPAYSPDLNPVEQLFARFKSFLLPVRSRQARPRHKTLLCYPVVRHALNKKDGPNAGAAPHQAGAEGYSHKDDDMRRTWLFILAFSAACLFIWFASGIGSEQAECKKAGGHMVVYHDGVLRPPKGECVRG